MKEKVTKKNVEGVKPKPSKDVFLWDTSLRGFGLRVKPSGVKSFVVAYYAPGLHRVRRRITLGAYGELTVEGARKKATGLLARVVAGEDPALEKADARQAAEHETVGKLLAQYLDDGTGRKKPRTLEFYESLGNLYIIPALGTLPVAKVTARDVARLHHHLRDKPVTANRVARLIRSFFYWLAKRELVSGKNPAKDIDWFPEQGRERFLTVEEMARLGQALCIAETIGLAPAPKHRKAASKKRKHNDGMFGTELHPANPVAVAALRFLAFSGWREREALTLQWDFVDFATAVATLPDTKTGKSVRAVAAPALEILAAQPRMKGSPYVFPGRDSMKSLREIQRLWYSARCAAKLEDVRLHDLRHSVASFAVRRNVSLLIIQSLMGHKDYRSTLRYAHVAADVRKLAADDVGETIRAAMAAEPDTQSDVTPLHKQR